MLAGPIWLFRTQSIDDKISGAIGVAILLPCMFVVGIWCNRFTIGLAVLGALSWLTVGFWIECMASI